MTGVAATTNGTIWYVDLRSTYMARVRHVDIVSVQPGVDIIGFILYSEVSYIAVFSLYTHTDVQRVTS